MEKIPFYDVEITGGYWLEKQKLVYEKTVKAVYDRFADTGRIETMNCKKSKSGQVAHVFWASDVFKWIEGVSYILEKHPEDTELREKVEKIIGDVEAGVAEDGYYNSHFNCPEVTTKRFTDRAAHELYTVGHMIEAGIAYSHATGDERFLSLCRKNADLVYDVFLKEGSAGFATPGHEEIELALVKLYDVTGEKKYLELSEFFVRQRGNNKKDYATEYDPEKDADNRIHSQSHLPIEKQNAVGHAVRAVYLYCAVADLAERLGDKELEETAKRLFDEIYEKKMYITGGIGMSKVGEAFGEPYDLPNGTAYAETCAALGFALFAHRMNTRFPVGKYGDAVERAIFNGMISGLSLDGEAFFYENPLKLDIAALKSPKFHVPTTQRKKVFDCSCCPPNLVRMIPSIGGLIYTFDEEYLYVNQYIASDAVFGGEKKVSMKTDYPASGTVTVRAQGARLAMRIPAWCGKFEASAPYAEKDGYIYFDASEVTVRFDMTPRFYMASPDVSEDAGKVALMRGPIVYCMESKDEPCRVFRCAVNAEKVPEVSDEFFDGLPVLYADGYAALESVPLYAPYRDVYSGCRLKFIPYAAFANRGQDDMAVWTEVKK